jgi:hypothetical protein
VGDYVSTATREDIMTRDICCSNCVKVGKESYSKGYLDAMEHFKKEIELTISNRPTQIVIQLNNNDHLIWALQNVVNLINNLESYGALKHEYDWPKVRRVREIVSEALLKEGRLS